MARKYLGGSGEALTVWISVAASTVLVFYGYDQVSLMVSARFYIARRVVLTYRIKGVFGNIIIGENFLNIMGNPSATLQSTITSLYTIGAFVGSLTTIWTGDIVGRPRQLIIGSAIVAIGAIIQATSFGVPQMIVGRIVAGVGTGINTATASIWQAETSKMDSRGKLIIIQMVCLVRQPLVPAKSLVLPFCSAMTCCMERRLTYCYRPTALQASPSPTGLHSDSPSQREA